jgi:6-phosphogluconolactonase/glucosamine-6-phosphate isomerase/deaminase
MQFEKFPSAEKLTEAVADLLAAEFVRRSEQPRLVMLAGGRTPLGAYAQIVARGLTADANLYLCLSDERHVQLTSPDSNAGQLLKLVKALKLPFNRQLFPNTAMPLTEAVRDWGEQLGNFLRRGGTLPLGILGLGADGHTASLFSLDDVLRGHDRLTQAVRRPSGPERISLTADLLMKFERLVIVTAGADKLPMVERLRTTPMMIPAGMVTIRAPRGECWYAD